MPPRTINPGALLTARAWWLLPALLSTALAVPSLFGDRWPSDAAYYVAIALKAAREGHWWTLAQGDLPYFNKPPLAFWLHAACVRLLGEHVWIYKLPEAAAYVLTCVGVAGLAARLYGRRTGVFAGLAMALTHDWVWRIGNVRLDFPHTLFLLLAAWCWAIALDLRHDDAGEPRAVRTAPRPLRWAALAGVCVAAALMTKPLVALAWPLFGTAWLACCGRLTRPAIGALAVSLGVALALAAPWHISMAALHGRPFIDAYFVTQSYKRASGALFDPEPWWWYLASFVDPRRHGVPHWPMLAHYALALSGLACIIFGRFVTGRAPPFTRDGDALAALWSLAWLAALSAFPDKRNYYALVLHPGTSLLVAALAHRVFTRLDARPGSPAPRVPAGERAARALAIVALVAAIAFAVNAPFAAARARRQIIQPERDALAAFLRDHTAEPVYNAGLIYPDAGVLYVKAGVWPRSLVEKEPVPRNRVPPGAIMVFGTYHDLQDRAPGTPDPRDAVVFTADGPFARYEARRRSAD